MREALIRHSELRLRLRLRLGPGLTLSSHPSVRPSVSALSPLLFSPSLPVCFQCSISLPDPLIQDFSTPTHKPLSLSHPPITGRVPGMQGMPVSVLPLRVLALPILLPWRPAHPLKIRLPTGIIRLFSLFRFTFPSSIFLFSLVHRCRFCLAGVIPPFLFSLESFALCLPFVRE